VSLFERACVNKRLFLFLLLVCILVNIAVLPYASSLGLLHINELPVPFAVAILILIAQAAINSAIAIFVGLFLGKKVGLGAPILEAWINSEPLEKRLRPILIISVVSGIFVGVALFILDRFAFAFFAEPVTAFQEKTPMWQRFLICFYGGIGEEVFMRLFLMTLVVWIVHKLARKKDTIPSDKNVWLSIIVASVVFGLGHLPMTATFTEITPVVVIRSIVLNGIAGVVFGWLYWKKGLEASIISHFSADIILHVMLPSIY